MSIHTIHAHCHTSTRDCDGPVYDSRVEVPNHEEITESEEANGINDFSVIHFMERIFTMFVSPYAVHQLRLTMDDSGFEYHEQTEEGYRAGEIRWCNDDCDLTERSHRDVYAEMMGY